MEIWLRTDSTLEGLEVQRLQSQRESNYYVPPLQPLFAFVLQKQVSVGKMRCFTLHSECCFAWLVMCSTHMPCIRRGVCSWQCSVSREVSQRIIPWLNGLLLQASTLLAPETATLANRYSSLLINRSSKSWQNLQRQTMT